METKKENLQDFTFSFSRRHRTARCTSSNPALGNEADYFLIVCFFVSKPQ
jgi:hypothetical protein